MLPRNNFLEFRLINGTFLPLGQTNSLRNPITLNFHAKKNFHTFYDMLAFFDFLKKVCPT